MDICKSGCDKNFIKDRFYLSTWLSGNLQYRRDLRYIWACRKCGNIGIDSQPPDSVKRPQYYSRYNFVVINNESKACDIEFSEVMYGQCSKVEDEYKKGHLTMESCCTSCVMECPEHNAYWDSQNCIGIYEHNQKNQKYASLKEEIEAMEEQRKLASMAKGGDAIYKRLPGCFEMGKKR